MDPYVQFLTADAARAQTAKGFFDPGTAQMTAQLIKTNAAKKGNLQAQSRYLTEDQIIELGGTGGGGTLGQKHAKEMSLMSSGMAGRNLSQSGVFTLGLKDLGVEQQTERAQAGLKYGRSQEDIVRELNTLGVDAPTQTTDYLLNGARQQGQDLIKRMQGTLSG